MEAILSTLLLRLVVSDSSLYPLPLYLARVSFTFEPHTVKAVSVCVTSL